MPIDLTTIPTQLVEAAKKHRLIPLVGSGMSKQAAGSFPNWRELLDILIASALSQGGISKAEKASFTKLIDKGQYLMAAEDLRYKLPIDAYENILKNQFDPPGVVPSEVHRQLFRLEPPLIITTNYDRLLEDAYASRYGRAPSVFTYEDAASVQAVLQEGDRSGRSTIFKIHGSIDQVNKIILSERDYRKLLYSSPGYRLVISAVFLTSVVIFLGFSFGDPELRLLLEQHRESLKHRSQPDYILLPSDSYSAVEQRRIREDYGLQVISYKATAGHPELHVFVSHLADKASGL